MYTIEEEYELTRNLLYAMGLCVNKSGYLEDQDTQRVIQYDKLSVKASIDHRLPVYLSENDIKFDPTSSRFSKIMMYFFGMFLSKEEELGEIPKVLSYYVDEVVIDKKAGIIDNAVNIKFADGSIYTTNTYKNKTIAYCEAILQLEGSFDGDIDLNKFDILDDEKEEKKKDAK